ncbi:MAG: hypothetical protein BYD32DRAFT_69964 [Podila humilis]|nr:MAG: hypothetical protein BYD32DRAFT_69964 [Podila humilis]
MSPTGPCIKGQRQSVPFHLSLSFLLPSFFGSSVPSKKCLLFTAKDTIEAHIEPSNTNSLTKNIGTKTKNINSFELHPHDLPDPPDPLTRPMSSFSSFTVIEYRQLVYHPPIMFHHISSIDTQLIRSRPAMVSLCIPHLSFSRSRYTSSIQPSIDLSTTGPCLAQFCVRVDPLYRWAIGSSSIVVVPVLF